MVNLFRRKRRILFLMVLIALVLSSCGITSQASVPPVSTSAPATNASCYQQVGVSLSGAEWSDPRPGEYPTTDELPYYASKGVKVIRLSMSWSRLQPKLFGDLAVGPDSEIEWLKYYILQANAVHMTVIIDNHLRNVLDDLNFGVSLPGSALADFWEKMAKEMKDTPGICGYDIANEPANLPGYASTWPSQANATIEAIRKVDASHYVFVNNADWSSTKRWKSTLADQIHDSANLIVFEGHSYWDPDASGKYDLTKDPKAIPPATDEDAKVLVTESLVPFLSWCTKTNNKCFLGEFGVPPDKTWLTALNEALSYMKQNDIGGTYWAGGVGWIEDNYPLSIEPTEVNGESVDRPQMTVLEKYLK